MEEQEAQNDFETPKARRLPPGSSDPVSFSCTCPASISPDGGLVLLFYRYFASPPFLPTPSREDISSLASFHETLTQALSLGGKIRIGSEGFNITVGGTKKDITSYIIACTSHWSFKYVDLSTQDKRNAFFKPTSNGCACVFGGAPASVRITEEITPMGVTNYVPADWDSIEVLSPAEWHERCHTSKNAILIDVRNHYESRIGYFISPITGEAAVRPGIRRFSQWPLYVRRFYADQTPTQTPIPASAPDPSQGSEEVDKEREKEYMTFCTGGIRCEKGARFLQENTRSRVSTLRGGIAAYLTWMGEEIASGRKTPVESLFKGRNYVFDARGSTSIPLPTSTSALEKGGPMELIQEPVAQCHVCGKKEDRLGKCRSKGCHLILVVCEDCERVADPRCCGSCKEMEDGWDERKGRKPICDCEREREMELWEGGRTGSSKQAKKQGRREKSGVLGMNGIKIEVKVID